MINFIVNSGKSFFSLRKSLAEYLLKNGDYLTIFTPNNLRNIKQAIKSKQLKVIKYELNENKKSLLNFLKNTLSLFNKFNNKRNSTNIIFGSYLNLLSGFIFFFAQSKKNIYVFTGLGSFFNHEKKVYIEIVKFCFNLILLKKNSFFIFYNKEDRDFLIRKNLLYKSKIILGSGIKINKVNYRKPIKKTINFVFFSRLNSDKGLYDLIKAIKIVNSNGYRKKCNFYIHGLFDDNPTTVNKKVLIELLKDIKNCSLEETSYKVKLKKIFSNKHVFILPSHREGLPKTALEAMNFNCALILSKIPGHKFLIDKKNVNGLFFQSKNEIDLSNKIIWMINNPKKLIQYTQNSKKNLSKFSDKKINSEFYDTIKKI